MTPQHTPLVGHAVYRDDAAGPAEEEAAEAAGPAEEEAAVPRILQIMKSSLNEDEHQIC